MIKTLFQHPWLRIGAAILVTGGVGIGIYAAVAPKQMHHPAIAENLPPEALKITAFRSPTCGCCGVWIEHMKAHGFQVEDNITEDLEGVKREHNVPDDLASCHTAIANGYVIEGHIPAADVKRLLAEKPDVAGIAVPGMPIGSPGMESGNIKEPYSVFTFDEAGQTTVFAEHHS
ncbi:DUF411 domain-containing protein [Acaryochloris sp. CCMEE 5410]|uniref:DUF411 domain-containing protein n=1 Tax=Acaryochloris sp. CCMEE 5410 TaxID=310037 RepID=UPI0002484D81|nr:DUF411 domain-containing protein [Acaryochloris sp. CCMEE 5410]KAI9129962.1 DUF411 domain-containing protein [Acaryochloris sp. CCMEE 5410]